MQYNKACTSINHSVKYGNQVYILDVDDENIIINKNIFLQQSGEIRHTNASLPDKDVLVTFTIKVHLSFFSLDCILLEDSGEGTIYLCVLSICKVLYGLPQ